MTPKMCVHGYAEDNLKNKQDNLNQRHNEVAKFAIKVMHSSTVTLHLLHAEKYGFVASIGVDTMSSLYQFLANNRLHVLLERPNK